jgi:hypothetical protein
MGGFPCHAGMGPGCGERAACGQHRPACSRCPGLLGLWTGRRRPSSCGWEERLCGIRQSCSPELYLQGCVCIQQMLLGGQGQAVLGNHPPVQREAPAWTPEM